MTQIYRAYAGLMPLVWLLTVLGIGGAYTLYRRRSRKIGTRMGALGSVVADTVLVGNLTALVVLTLTPGHAEPRSLNLIPFLEVVRAWNDTSGATAPVVEIVGNMLLFLPFAAVVGLRWSTVDRFWRVSGLVLAIATGIETLQLVLGLGRVASVTDVLLGVAGGMIGRGVGDSLRWGVRRSRHEPSREAALASVD